MSYVVTVNRVFALQEKDSFERLSAVEHLFVNSPDGFPFPHCCCCLQSLFEAVKAEGFCLGASEVAHP